MGRVHREGTAPHRPPASPHGLSALAAVEPPPITIRRIGARDGGALRRIRLEALDDMPGDFTATLADARALTDERWDEIAAANASGANQAIWLAYAGGEPAGMLAAFRTLDDVVTLTSMWAAPEFRRIGLAEALIDAATEWATVSAARHLRLWARADNASARRFYEDLGFSASGATMGYEPDPRQIEVELRRRLGPVV